MEFCLGAVQALTEVGELIHLQALIFDDDEIRGSIQPLQVFSTDVLFGFAHDLIR